MLISTVVLQINVVSYIEVVLSIDWFSVLK